MSINKIRKLLSLPKEEIAFRLREKGTEYLEFALHSLGQDALTERKWTQLLTSVYRNRESTDGMRTYFKSSTRDRFFTEAYDKTQRISLIKKHFPYQSWLHEADHISNGDLTFLGLDVKDAFQSGWHSDPLEKISWPRTFYAHVKHDPGVKGCDIKFIWELNRHQYLVVLAKAYWLTGDEKYAEKVITIIQDWIRENPYHSGVNWTSSLELAVRALAWIWSYFFCAGSDHITPDFHNIFLQSIYEHGHHIERHLSIYSSPYNHLIGELAALHVIGSLFPQFTSSGKWETLGWNTMVEQVEKQFHEDGLTVEQATFYHHFTLGFYLQSVLLRKINNKDVPDNVLSRLEIALDFSLYITKPDGSLPMFGDIDNARSLYFNTSHSWDFRGFLGLGAILFERQDFKFACKDLTEEIIWLCDDRNVQDLLSMSGNPPQELSKGFHKSGYYISRDSFRPDSHYLCFDCGEIAEGLFETAIPSAAHGHADALSFVLAAYGKSILVDGGFFTYFGELDWHKSFREEEAHNTVKIGNLRQAEYCGRLTWQSVKQPHITGWKTTDKYDFIAGEIEFDVGVSHERKIIYVKNQFWLICDFVSADSHAIESYLHFDPLVNLSSDKNQQTILAANGNAGVLIRYYGEADLHTAKGKKNPSEGWVGLGYGIRKPAWKVKFQWGAQETKQSIFPLLIVPWEGDHRHIETGQGTWYHKEERVLRANFSFRNKEYSFVIDNQKKITITTYNDKFVSPSTSSINNNSVLR